MIKNNSPNSYTHNNLQENVTRLWQRPWLLSPKHRALMTTVLLHHTHALFHSERVWVLAKELLSFPWANADPKHLPCMLRSCGRVKHHAAGCRALVSTKYICAEISFQSQKVLQRESSCGGAFDRRKTKIT